ncbi:MAG: type IV toxin-antitoxin system AbiEi family antitoxin [Balneolaceae bacterium]|nr:type IV toxin-antitoxin system AbiEi family antitoxin [Balneolaceae bacterium]
MKEEEIVHTAIENLEPTLLKGKWHPYKKNNKILDGVLELWYEDQNVRFDAIVKKELRTYQVEQLIQQAGNYKNLMVIAYKLFPGLKKKLKGHRINYLEANGNLFVNAENLLLFLDGDKKLNKTDKTGNRAFTPTGLKVLFEFLRDKRLINQTQREIAEKAGVALGNIPKVLQGLMDTGQIYKLDKKKYAFHDRKELLQQWIREYHNTLKPTLEMGRYTAKRTEDWKEIPLNLTKTVWGGEPAADLLTNYLKPGVLTLYTEETKKDLMVNYGLMPDKEGNLFAYQKFWKNDETDNTAPPILVYADLIMTNDKRCIETANILFNERIEPKL